VVCSGQVTGDDSAVPSSGLTVSQMTEGPSTAGSNDSAPRGSPSPIVSDRRRRSVHNGSRASGRSAPPPTDGAGPDVFSQLCRPSGGPNSGGPESDGPDADGPWDRIADLLIEWALDYDPTILEPVDRAAP
jgi:hypothetical protein